MAENKRIDEPTGTQTVGHEWDGIEELNTPLPRWWLLTFYATIVFWIGYWLYMQQTGLAVGDGKLIDEHPRPGSRGTMVAFVHPKTSFGTLIELVEER